MKVLGLSFGRKGQNCDILVKEALFGAQAAGAEISFINMMNLKITHCIGCGACDRRREKGGPSRCVLKDDFPFVEDAILEADAIVIAAPVYVLGPIGQYKNLVDRLGPSHDRSVMEKVNAERIAVGKSGEELLDPRLFKDRYLGLISVGGARTEHWTSMGLPNMKLLSFSMQMRVIDEFNAYGMGDRVNPTFDEALISRINQMGRNLAETIGKPYDEAPWFGDKPGVCPHCHGSMLTLKSGTTVECPLCGMEGTLSLVDGEIKVEFSPEQQEHSRARFGGVEDHRVELASIMEHVFDVLGKRGAEIPERTAKYNDIQPLDKSKFVENMKQ